MSSFVLILFVCVVFAAAQEWEDTEITSSLWSSCSRHDTRTFAAIIEGDPSASFSRSADGRGPLFWAYEFGHQEAIDLLEGLGVSPAELDSQGKSPTQLGIDNEEINKHREFPIYPDPSELDDEEEEGEEEEDGEEEGEEEEEEEEDNDEL